MLIRKAKAEDSSQIAGLLLLAMGDIIFSFIGENSIEKATDLLESLVKIEVNQYSFENCWVVEEKKNAIAVACIYDGAKLQKLRVPVASLIESKFGRKFLPEDETQAGEFYIDCIAVGPDQQGKGLGSRLIEFLIEEYVHQHNLTLGLLVEKNNPKAKSLYLNLGFERIGEKKLVGKMLDHLQFLPNSVELVSK